MTSNYPPGVTDSNFDKLCWNETYRFNRACMCCHEPVADQADQDFCSYCEPVEEHEIEEEDE